MAKKTYITVTRLQHNGTVYEPNTQFPATRAEEGQLETLLTAGVLHIPDQPARPAPPTRSLGDEESVDGEAHTGQAMAQGTVGGEVEALAQAPVGPPSPPPKEEGAAPDAASSSTPSKGK
jgi:hypothetical protein